MSQHRTTRKGNKSYGWTLRDFGIHSCGVNTLTNNEDKNSRHSTEKLHENRNAVEHNKH